MPNSSADPEVPVATPRNDIELALDDYRRLVQMLSGARPTELLESNVTMAQMKVLMLLSAGEAGMSELASTLHLSLSTVSGLVDRLVDAGLVERHSHPEDRRQVIASLTEAGFASLDRLQELGISHLRELMETLQPTDIATVRRALDVLITAARRLRQEETQ